MGVSVGIGVSNGISVSVGTGSGVSVSGGGSGVSVGTGVGVSVGTGVSLGTGVGVSVGTGVFGGTGVNVSVGRGLLVGRGVAVLNRPSPSFVFVGLLESGGVLNMKTSTSSTAVPGFSKVILTKRAASESNCAVTVCGPGITPLKPACSESKTGEYSRLSLLLFTLA